MIVFCFFFFNDTATTEIYTLSLHDALPIYGQCSTAAGAGGTWSVAKGEGDGGDSQHSTFRSEEHTSELQSQSNLVCRLLLEKKKNQQRPCSPGAHVIRHDQANTTPARHDGA